MGMLVNFLKVDCKGSLDNNKVDENIQNFLNIEEHIDKKDFRN